VTASNRHRLAASLFHTPRQHPVSVISPPFAKNEV